MAYDIYLTPKVVGDGGLTKLEEKIEKIEEHGVELKVKDDIGLIKIRNSIKEIEEHGIEIKTKEDSGFLEIKDKIKKLEEDGINLEVKLKANNAEGTEEVKKNITAITKLIQQLNVLAGFDESKLNKTIDLHVNVDNLTKQISEGLAVLNKINPEIAFDTAKLRDSFRKFKNDYNETLAGLGKYDDKKGMLSKIFYFDDMESPDKFLEQLEAASDASKDLYRTLLSIEELLRRDPSLALSYDPKKEAQLQSAAEFYNKTIKTMGNNSQGFYDEYTESLKDEIKELQEELEKSDEPDKAIEKTLNSKTKALNTFEKKYRAILSELGDESLSRPVTDKELFKDQPKSVWDGIKGQTKKDNKEVGGSLKDLGDQTESFIERFQTAITKLHTAMSGVGTDTNSIAKNIGRLKTILDQMNQAVQQIKSPFDEESISNTATRLEELFKQYNALDGTEKTMNIGVEIDPKDEKKLANISSYADKIQTAIGKLVTYKVVGGGTNSKDKQKKDNKPSDTEVPENLQNALDAFNELKDKEVNITFEFPNLKLFDSVVEKFNELSGRTVKTPVGEQISQTSGGNSDNDEGGTSANPLVAENISHIVFGVDAISGLIEDVGDKLDTICKKPSSSTQIKTVANNVVAKLEEIRALLPTLHSSSKKTPIVADPSDSFRDGDLGYTVADESDNITRIFRTLQETYKWIAKADLSQMSKPYIREVEKKGEYFEPLDPIEDITEDRLYEIVSQYGDATARVYEAMRREIANLGQSVEKIIEHDYPTSSYDAKAYLDPIMHNSALIGNAVQNIEKLLNSSQNPNSIESDEASSSTKSATNSTEKSSVNGGMENGNTEAIRIIGEGVKNSTNLLSQAVDDFDGFCRRFLLRFPLPQNGSDTSASNAVSSNNNSDESNKEVQAPSKVVSSIESISQKSDEIIKKLAAIQEKIPTVQSVASEIATVSSHSQPMETEPKPSISTDESSNNEGSDSGKAVLTQISTSVGNVVQHGEDIVKKLTAIQKKIPTAKSLVSAKAESDGGSTESNNGDTENQSMLSTLITPKLGTIQALLTNIEAKMPNEQSTKNNSNNTVAPPASSDVKNINKNVGTLSTTIKTLNGKVNEIAKKVGKTGKEKNEGKNNISGVTDKLKNLPTNLSSIKQTNSSISKNTKAIQTNTGNTSTKVAQVRDTIKSKADQISGQLTAIGNSLAQNNAKDPNAPTSNNFATLEEAIKTLTTTINNPSASSNVQDVQNSAAAPSQAQAAANMANVSNLRVQAGTRIEEFQKVLDIMRGGAFSGIFGTTSDIESYIKTLETLNKEIINAGRLLNRTDITPLQRSNAENTISTNRAILNGYINGDDSLGISTAQIANINTLLKSMETINDRLGNTDHALTSLKRLKETLESYNISVQPLEDAINNLKSTKSSLKQMSDKISSSSLTEGELSSLQTTIASTETSYQNVIDESNKLLNTNQNDSLKNVTEQFTNAEKEVEKYKTKISALKNLLVSLKGNKITLDTFDMENGHSAKDLQDFIDKYEQFLSANKNITDVSQMQNFATNFTNNYQAPLKAYVENLDDARRKLKEMNQQVRQTSEANSFNKQLADFTTRVEKWRNANGKALNLSEFNSEYQRILTALKDGSTTAKPQLDRLKSDFALLTLRANQAGVATKSFTTKLKEMYKKYGGWTLVTKTMNTAMRLLRSMVTQVKEVDTAMTNLKKVTEATGSQLNTFLESAGKRSVALGASLTDYIDAVSEFSRLGKSLDEAQKLGELATTYKTVAEDLDIKTASKSIISTMQAFNGVGVQADEIVDKFNYVGNNFAASSAEIGESLQRSAAALNGAQNSLSESIALTTAGK